MLETFTGLKAFDRARDDPELVSKSYNYVNDSKAILYFMNIMVQAIHFEDHRQDMEKFKGLADSKLDPITDQILVTTIYNIIKKTLVRHSIRATAAEVCYFSPLCCSIIITTSQYWYLR